MQDDRSPGALMDDAIAREIETALAVEPSPEFLAGVRARIASEPAPTGWHFHWHWAAAAAIVVVAASVAVLRVGPEPPATVQVGDVLPSHPLHVGDVAHARVIRPRELGTSGSRIERPVVPEVRRAAVPSGEPEVLIPAAERAALRRLLTMGIRGEEIKQTPASAVMAEPADTQTIPDEITIPLIAIEPLPPMGPSQGERQ